MEMVRGGQMPAGSGGMTVLVLVLAILVLPLTYPQPARSDFERFLLVGCPEWPRRVKAEHIYCGGGSDLIIMGLWSSGMILLSGRRGLGFDSPQSPFHISHSARLVLWYIFFHCDDIPAQSYKF